MVSYSCPATGTSMAAGAGPGPWWEGEEQERLKQLASASEFLWGQTWSNMQGTRGSCADLWLHQWQNRPSSSAQQFSMKNDCCCCVFANNSLCFSSLFLAGSTHLNFAGLGGVKPKRNLLLVSQEAVETGHSTRSFLVRGTLSGWGVPSWC